MFNIQPGTGLGFTGSKQIALGLGGVAEAVIIDEPTEYGGAAFLRQQQELRARIMKDDQEIMELAQMIIASGVLDEL